MASITMIIRYTLHAEDRLQRRGITKDEAEEALRSGQKSEARDGLRKSSQRNLNGMLVVIYNILGPSEVEVITIYQNNIYEGQA
jgi:Domain of unknown function (DUF4258)